MRKKIVSLGIAIWLSISPLQAFVDFPNLIQNTITAIQEVYSYSKEVTDWVKTAAYYLDNLDKISDEISKIDGMRDVVQNFNDISKIYSDFSNLYKDLDEFSNQVLKDPQGFINGKLKDSFKKYQLFDKCKDLKGDELNICLRETINYAFEYDELNRNKQEFTKLKDEAEEMIETAGNSQDIKESMDWNNRMQELNSRAQQLQLKMLQDLQRFQVEQKELEDQKRQLMAKNVSTTTDSSSWLIPSKYK